MNGRRKPPGFSTGELINFRAGVAPGRARACGRTQPLAGNPGFDLEHCGFRDVLQTLWPASGRWSHTQILLRPSISTVSFSAITLAPAWVPIPSLPPVFAT